MNVFDFDNTIYDGESGFDIFLYFLKKDFYAENQIEVTTMDLLIDFSKVGLGVGCVIREFVEKELEDGSLTELTPPYPLPKRTVGFAYNRLSAQSDSVKRFVQFFKGEYYE